MKRIIKETDSNGKTRYVVEKNRILGFIPWRWHTDTFYDADTDMEFYAIFDCFSEAAAFVGLSDRTKVHRKEVWNSDDREIKYQYVDEFLDD